MTDTTTRIIEKSPGRVTYLEAWAEELERKVSIYSTHGNAAMAASAREKAEALRDAVRFIKGAIDSGYKEPTDAS